MRILISGASGLVGTHLMPVLQEKGHEIFRLVRKPPKNESEIQWDAAKGFSDTQQARLEGFDAVVHLAGDNVASENWSAEKKRRIRESREIGTRVLVEALRKTQNPPKTLVSASAVGFYGNRKDEVLTEDSPKGEGFFPEVCDAWEREARRAEEFGVRVVNPRIGVVLAKEDGALAKMLTPFKLGVGGVVGSGEQYMSWIALEDLIRIIVFALENESLRGAYNATAPTPATNEEFVKTLGKVINRPTFLPTPSFAVKLLFGEMGETLLLEGCRVVPKRLQEAGFEFKYADLEAAMRAALD